MANSPVDKSKEFEESGMTLITEIKSEYWLKKSQKMKKEVKYTERLDD
jgi:hypothetical protein